MAYLLQHTEEDRRRARRHNLRTAVRVRVWKSGTPEQKAESLNLSQRGIYFVTDAPPPEGETIEILLNMPQEITGEPTTEWRCTGHVMHTEPINSPHGKFGVGVQFDCYEVSRFEQERLLLNHGLRWRSRSDR